MISSLSPDQPSHTVLITNLANWVQPIIRYNLGDSITAISGPCSCGSITGHRGHWAD